MTTHPHPPTPNNQMLPIVPCTCLIRKFYEYTFIMFHFVMLLTGTKHTSKFIQVLIWNILIMSQIVPCAICDKLVKTFHVYSVRWRTERQMDRWRGNQAAEGRSRTDKETDRQSDGLTDTQIDRQADRQTDRQAHTQTNRMTAGSTNQPLRINS